MSKRISFKLNGEPKKLALALQHQLYREGTSLSLDQIVERMFVNWMYSNLATNNDGESHVTTSTPENSQGHPESMEAPVHSNASPEST